MSSSLGEVRVAPKLTLSIDLGPLPLLSTFIRQQIAIDQLALYSMLEASWRVEPRMEDTLGYIKGIEQTLLILEAKGEQVSLEAAELRSELNETRQRLDQSRQQLVDQFDVEVVFSHLSSPWEILLSAASGSMPIAYGAAAMLGLHRLMTMVMTWQRHRLDVVQRRNDIEWSEEMRKLAASGVLSLREAQHLREAFEGNYAPDDQLGAMSAPSSVVDSGLEDPESSMDKADPVDKALAQLGMIQSAKLSE